MTNPDSATDQAQPQSIADRVAAQFGLTDDQPEAPATPEYTDAEIEAAGEDEGEPAPESEFAEIEYEGTRYQIPKPLEKAILQEKDYTQKTQTLAEQRRQVEYTQKALEAARLEREFHESIQSDLQQLQMMDNWIGQMKSADVSQLPIDELIRHKMGVDNIKEQREELNRKVEAKRNEYSQKAREQVKALKAQARELASKQIPNFSDATLAELGQYAQSVGYTEQDVEMMQLDPRATAMLHKARLYDQLQASKSDAVTKAKSAPPVVKPGSSNPMPQQVREKLGFLKAMKSAKTSQDKAKLIEQEMARRF